MKKLLITSLLVLGAAILNGQEWHFNPPGNIVTGPEYLGAAAGSQAPLRLKTIPRWPIDFFTEGRRRWTLLPSAAYPIGPFLAPQSTTGYALMCPDVDGFYAAGGPGPYSLLHLAAATDNTQSWSYRPWMKTGISMTGNRDHNYFGQKFREVDYTDVVVHWSDNPGKALKDRLRFIFTSGYNDQASFGAESFEGLEGMRLYPVDNLNVNVGVGNWHEAGIVLGNPNIEPAERLDIYDGRVRIRELPTSLPQPTLHRFMVVDDDGVVHWRPAPTSCDWIMNTQPPFTNNHISTGFGLLNSACPDETDAVGIGVDLGTTIPLSKLNIRTESFEQATEITLDQPTGFTAITALNVNAISNASAGGAGRIGIRVTATGTTDTSRGIVVTTSDGTTDAAAGEFLATDAAQIGVGVFGGAQNADVVIGVDGSVSTMSHENIGVRGSTLYPFGGGYDTDPNSIFYGVAGYAHGNDIGQRTAGIYGWSYHSGNENWAGYFEGNVNIAGDLQIQGNGYINGLPILTSDQSVKDQIDSLEGALAIIEELIPRTYTYRINEFPHLGFPEQSHMGFIAQEVEQVLPNLVEEFTTPLVLDSLGEIIAQPVSLKGINYIELIALLVKGTQEQQILINAQNSQNDLLNDRIDQLEQMILDCCQNRSEPQDERSGTIGSSESDGILRIQPNPFTERTTVYYQLERSGRMQLMANSSDGKQLRVLEEAQREAGLYQFEWMTADLAPGIYYVTLLLDGEPIVKKAVKVR